MFEEADFYLFGIGFELTKYFGFYWDFRSKKDWLLKIGWLVISKEN